MPALRLAWRRCLAAGLGLGALAHGPDADAFELLAEPPGTILVMNLDLLPTTRFNTIGYGARSWNELAEAALARWNQVGIGPVPDHSFFRLRSPTTVGNPCAPDGVNEVRFQSTICGMGWGTTIGVTTRWSIAGRTVEADVRFNDHVPMNAYPGPILPAAGGGALFDFARLALHEFGHAAGLGHPNLAGQNVLAVMNSGNQEVGGPQSAVDDLQLDDMAGARAIRWQVAAASPRLVNISSRARVETGDNVMIGGFVIGGTAPKTVLVRARGPSLASFGVPGVLGNPFLQIFAGQTAIADSDDWQTPRGLCQATGNACGSPADIAATGLAPANPLESAILITLAPGAYTAIVSGAGGTTGVGIVEVFEPSASAGASRLVNISTRARVETGDNVMIGGFVIGGSAPKTVLVRAVGPSLAASGVPGALANPSLRIFSGSTAIADNDDWQVTTSLCQSTGHTCGAPSAIASTGLAPVNPMEAAILIALPPGLYTAIVSGVEATSGVGLVEVYETSASPALTVLAPEGFGPVSMTLASLARSGLDAEQAGAGCEVQVQVLNRARTALRELELVYHALDANDERVGRAVLEIPAIPADGSVDLVGPVLLDHPPAGGGGCRDIAQLRFDPVSSSVVPVP